MLKAFIKPIRQPRIEGQWSHAPTNELAELLRIMFTSVVTTSMSQTEYKKLSFPKTAYEFITVVPEPHHKKRLRNSILQVERGEEYWAWVGLYNSRVFYAYWKMIGDAFDVTSREFKTVKRPQGWNDVKLFRRTTNLARELWSKNTMSACQVERSHGGHDWLNWDFYSNDLGREIIDELDQLVLAAYGLSNSPLKNQLEILRTGSIHEFPLDEDIK